MAVNHFLLDGSLFWNRNASMNKLENEVASGLLALIKKRQDQGGACRDEICAYRDFLECVSLRAGLAYAERAHRGWLRRLLGF